MAKMPRGDFPEAGECKHFGRVTQTEVDSSVTLAFPALHCVGANGDRTVEHPGQVYSEEWQSRVGNGIDQVSNHAVELGAEPVVFPAVRDDPESCVKSLHGGEPVGHQAGTDKQLIRPERIRSGVNEYFLTAFCDPGHPGAHAGGASAPPELLQHDVTDAGKIHDAGFPDQESAGAGYIRLDFLQFAGTEKLGVESVFTALCEQAVHSLQFNFVGGDQQFSGLFAWNAIVTAKLVSGSCTLLAELRLEASGFVVNAGMDDAAIATGLVPGRC